MIGNTEEFKLTVKGQNKYIRNIIDQEKIKNN